MMQAYANTVSRTDADAIRVPETNGTILLISRQINKERKLYCGFL